MLLTPSADNHAVRRSLILAGGGIRVAYQAGVLRAMEEEGLSFNHVDGTSGGTINAAMLFSGITPVDMCWRWSSLKISKFVSFLPFSDYLNPLKLKAMGDADGIINHVFPHLGIDLSKINMARPNCQATFNVCNHSTKQNLLVTNELLTLPHLIAGISLPMFMPAIEIDGDMYTDSVWIKDANMTDAVKRGAEELWLVWCIGNSHDYKNNSFLQYVHMIELSANGALLEEYDRILELNQRIVKGDSPYGQTQPIRLHVIKPPYPIPLDPDLFIGRISGQELINMGYQHAKAYLNEKKETGVQFDWQATSMQEPHTTAILRMKIVTKTLMNFNPMEFSMRAEAYNLDPEGFSSYVRPMAIYADISLAGEKNIPAISGELTVDRAAYTLKVQVQFNSAAADKLVGTLTQVNVWKMLIGFSSKLNLEVFANGELVDTAQKSIGLSAFLLLWWQVQIKEPRSFIQRLGLKWMFSRWLFIK